MTQFVDSVSIDENAPVQPTVADPNDSGSFGWAVLGFIIPLVGLILFLVWRDTKPKCAKKAGVGALVSVILSVVLSVLGAILSAMMFSSMAVASM